MGKQNHVPLSLQTGHGWSPPKTVCRLQCSSLPCWRIRSSCPETHRTAQQFSLSFTESTVSRTVGTHHTHGLVHVTVTKDDEGRLSTKLQRHLLHIAHSTASGGSEMLNEKGQTGTCCFVSTEFLSCGASPFHDVFSNFSGASETQFTHVWVVGQALSHQSTWRENMMYKILKLTESLFMLWEAVTRTHSYLIQVECWWLLWGVPLLPLTQQISVPSVESPGNTHTVFLAS